MRSIALYFALLGTMAAGCHKNTTRSAPAANIAHGNGYVVPIPAQWARNTESDPSTGPNGP